MRIAWLIAVMLSALPGLVAQTADPAAGSWDVPAAALAEQVAGILGPGQAHLTIQNLSSVSMEEIPAIRRLLEQDLKARGVVASGAESGNSIRVTLSENARERLWVAEVVEGEETRVAMVPVEAGAVRETESASGLTLRIQTVLTGGDPVLAALETANGLVVVEPEEIVFFNSTAEGWTERKRVGMGQKRPLARDARAVIYPSDGGSGFEAFTAGMECGGSYQSAASTADWNVHCRESDDPWTIVPAPATQPGVVAAEIVRIAPVKAFYNSARNYFTGVITPNVGVDPPPFYSAVLLPRPAGSGLLIGGIDGKVQIWEGAGIKPVTGARDWGSDFAALHTGCGSGTQIVVSGSGEAASDSLRVYELGAQEAIPASAPLAMNGTVTALAASPDGKSLLAVVRGAAEKYEVDRVTASCN